MRERDANTGDGQGSNHHGRECIRDLFPQTAIIAHVLFMMHCMDHGSRPQKQHGFEKRMREQVEHGDRIYTHARGDEHIAKLRTG